MYGLNGEMAQIYKLKNEKMSFSKLDWTGKKQIIKIILKFVQFKLLDAYRTHITKKFMVVNQQPLRAGPNNKWWRPISRIWKVPYLYIDR